MMELAQTVMRRRGRGAATAVAETETPPLPLALRACMARVGVDASPPMKTSFVAKSDRQSAWRNRCPLMPRAPWRVGETNCWLSGLPHAVARRGRTLTMNSLTQVVESAPCAGDGNAGMLLRSASSRIDKSLMEYDRDVTPSGAWNCSSEGAMTYPAAWAADWSDFMFIVNAFRYLTLRPHMPGIRLAPNGPQTRPDPAHPGMNPERTPWFMMMQA